MFAELDASKNPVVSHYTRARRSARVRSGCWGWAAKRTGCDKEFS